MNSALARLLLASFALTLTFGCSSSSSDDEAGGAASSQGLAVTGRVLLSGDVNGLAFPLSGEVRVIDVTMQDGPSTTVGSQKIQVTSAEPTPFHVTVEGIDPKNHYSVQVSIDSDGDGKTSVGDFLTEESYPVLNEWPSTRDVTAKRYSH